LVVDGERLRALGVANPVRRFGSSSVVVKSHHTKKNPGGFPSIFQQKNTDESAVLESLLKGLKTVKRVRHCQKLSKIENWKTRKDFLRFFFFFDSV
jgi:hypothetical protein